MGDLLVRGGTIVDGTGGPSRAGDVRVRDGLIVEVGPGLAPDGEPELDASGALVTPGLIDPHTHYDLEMFWDPTLDPQYFERPPDLSEADRIRYFDPIQLTDASGRPAEWLLPYVPAARDADHRVVSFAGRPGGGAVGDE